MDAISVVILRVLGILLFGGVFSFGIVSLREKEPRAAGISFCLALLLGSILFLASFLSPTIRAIILIALLLIGFTAILLCFLPIGKSAVGSLTPRNRFDERDVVFSRKRLKSGSLEYRIYYALRPGNKEIDDRIRSRAGLLSPRSQYANPFHFASAEGSFFLTEALREAVDGPVAPERNDLPPGEMTAYIKNLARYFGALDVGITELHPYHVYSNVGRGTGKYGDPILVEHRYAIAFTVEMQRDMVAAAPRATTVMESARQYVEAARVAVQLAAALRELGYPTRAHIDGNYRVIAPLLARDAGLGEIGRMSILMTPRLGPRVRLGVVTTDAGLIPDSYRPNPSLIDFCSICKKCAFNCPCQAIPKGERQEIDGALRWKMDADACFLYWNTVGTDCARCMAVCPYSHPDNPFHNLVRWGIARSGAFRRAALLLDDLFYGQKPAQYDPPAWTKVS